MQSALLETVLLNKNPMCWGLSRRWLSNLPIADIHSNAIRNLCCWESVDGSGNYKSGRIPNLKSETLNKFIFRLVYFSSTNALNTLPFLMAWSISEISKIPLPFFGKKRYLSVKCVVFEHDEKAYPFPLILLLRSKTIKGTLFDQLL